MSRKAQLDVVIDGDDAGARRAAERTGRAYQGLGRDLDGVDRKARSSRGGLGGLAGGLTRAAGVATVAGAGLAVAGGAAFKLAEAASDAGEAQSAAAAVFKSGYSTIERAAGNAATKVGISRTQYLDAAKSVGVLGNAAGLSGTDLTKFSTGIVGAAGDLASFNNTSVDEALQALQSGLRGEAEPLRRFGILLDDATLRQAALKQGLISSTKEALTPQQKTLAAQSVIMGQLGAAQGDFARTSGGMANQQRILKARLADTAATLGQKLLPYALKVVTWLNQAVPKFLKLAQVVGSRLSPYFKAAGRILGSFTSAGGKTSRAGQVLHDILDIVTGSARLFGNLIRTAVTPIMRGLRAGTDQVRQALEKNPRVMSAVRSALSGVASAMRALGPVGRVLGRVIGTVVGGAFRVVGGLISGAIGVVDRLIGAWQRARDIVSGAVAGIRSAISSLPGGGVLSGLLGLSGPPLVYASGMGAGGPARFARAAAGGTVSGTVARRAATGLALTVDQRTTVDVRVDGALDPVAVGDQIRQILRDADRRDGLGR